ncbi:type VI secretion system lipoprotein TssJ [Sulfurimonas sp.]
MKNLIKISISIIVLLMMSACANKSTYLDLVIKSHNNINPDNENISSPLMLNFYELDSAEQFSKLDYWTIVDNGKDRLSSDLISQNRHVIVPNEEQTYRILFDDKAKFLGIIGNFRNMDSNSTWRYVINLKDKSYNSVELEIDGNKIKEIN